jgi:hypothetical protein
LANCGNLKFPDLNFTVFGEKTLKKTGFGIFSPTFLGKKRKKIWKNWE